MTEYQARMFVNLDTLPMQKWYDIDPNRSDYSDFQEMIKLRIDLKDDFTFSEDYKRFKRIESFYDKVAEIAEVFEPIDWMKLVNAQHDTVKRELEIKYPTQRRW